jgi:hypothetical protein
MKIQILLLICVAAFVAGVTGCGSARGGGGYVLENAKTVLVAVDQSKSMYFNDPARLGPESIQAMIALAPPDSNFGVMTYGEEAKEVAPVTALRSRKDREDLAIAVNAITLQGKTDFGIAFKRSKEILDRAKANEGSSLVLLTDGQHNCGDTGLILDTVKSFGENRWEVNAIALTPSRRLSFIEEVAGEGGGEAFHITDTQGAVNASLKLAAQVDQMFAFLGKTSAVTVLPGTKNILLVAIGGAPGTGFVSLKPLVEANGIVELTRESPTAYTYPSSLEVTTYFDIMNVWSPLPGNYEIVTQGESQQSHVLCNLPVDISFQEGSIKELYGEGEAVKVAIEVNTDNVELYDIIKNSGTINVTAQPEGPGSRLTKTLELSEQKQDSHAALLFTGELQLFAGGSNPVEFNLIASLEIICPDDGAWHRVIRTTTSITPGGSVVVAEPMNLDFGSHWTDEEKVVRKFQVRSMYPNMVSVKVVEIPAGFHCDIVEFDITNELKQEVTLALDPAKVQDLGSREVQFLLDNVLEDGSKGIAFPVTIKAGIFEVQLPEKLTAAAHPGKEFTLDIPAKASPSLKFEYELEFFDSIKAEVVRKEDGSAYISFSVPVETDDGIYEGELKLTPEVEGLSARSIEVSLSVSGVPQIVVKPEEIKLEAKKTGWVQTLITIRVDHFEDMELGVGLKDVIESKTVDMLISGQYDCEFVPLEEWDGKKLEKGKDYKANLRFYISTDLRSGTYIGEAEFGVAYRGGKKASVKIPVKIELKR